MHRIDTPTAQIDKFGPGKNGFTNGDPSTGRRATDLNSDMWDAVQEEVANAIEGNGITLDKTKHNQLYLAIQKAITAPGFLKKANNLSDLEDTAEARGNLQLGTAATQNVGVATGDVIQIGTFGFASSLPAQNNVDLNELKNFGFYVVRNALNAPINDAGVLYVSVQSWNSGSGGDAFRSVQTAYSYANKNRMFCRTYFGPSSGWSAWVEFFSEVHKPTAEDVEAFPLVGGNVGKAGVVSAGDIKADKNNIIVKQTTQTGGDKGYYIQNGDGVNIAIITAYSDGSVRINSLVSGDRNLSFNGRINSDQELSEAGQRVYSPNNPQPISFPVTSVNGRTGAVALNDGFSTDGTSMFWDAFSSQLRIQVGTWSIGAPAGASTTVAFPKAFPNLCLIAIPIPNGTAATEQIGATNFTATTATFAKGIGDGASRSGKYLAIGY